MAIKHIEAEGKGILTCNRKKNDSYFYSYKEMQENIGEPEDAPDDDAGKIYVKQVIFAVEACDFNIEVFVLFISDRGSFIVQYNREDVTDQPESPE